MDRRTKRQKVQDMANQLVSPNEAKVAKKKLEILPPDPPLRPRIIIRIIGLNGEEIIYTVG